MPSSPFQNAAHKMFVIGGYPLQVTNMDVLTDAGWQQLPISFPNKQAMQASCLMVINETSFLMIVGATTTTQLTKETYIFNSIGNSWSPGPALSNEKVDVGCGTIKKSNLSNERLMVVIGGDIIGGSSHIVEFLDSIEGQWRQGQYLLIVQECFSW